MQLGTTGTMATTRTEKLTRSLEIIYQKHNALLKQYGWQHVYFVTKKVLFFSEGYELNTEILEAAAVTHDLHYLVAPHSQPEAGAALRQEYLQRADFTSAEAALVESIVLEAHMGTRHANISDAAKVLSDADTLYDALPTTAVLLANDYLAQAKDIGTLAHTITNAQRALLDQDIYFYTPSAKNHYLGWARTTLALWESLAAAALDQDVVDTLAITQQLDGV